MAYYSPLPHYRSTLDSHRLLKLSNRIIIMTRISDTVNLVNKLKNSLEKFPVIIMADPVKLSPHIETYRLYTAGPGVGLYI